tara:strand:+ start:118 stop:684 length:567 start_codon:yes stop_codon:yes gene_type:complete
MKNILVVIFTSLLLFVSCKDSSSAKETELLKKENELLKKELELNKRQTEEKNVVKIDVERETKKLFDQYAPKIEKTNSAIISNSEILIGDLNDDGLDDSLVYFVLTPAEGGNMLVGQEMAIYLNNGESMKVVAGYNPQNLFRPASIENNKIHIIEYEYAEDDYPNRPSIEVHKYFVLNGNKLLETKIY